MATTITTVFWGSVLFLLGGFSALSAQENTVKTVETKIATAAKPSNVKVEIRALMQEKDYEKAFSVLSECMSQPAFAKDAEMQRSMGICLVELGHYEEAVPYLEKVAKWSKSSPALWYLAIAQQHLYDFSGALASLERFAPQPQAEWRPRIDSLSAECRLGARAFAHIEDVVIIDSLLVPRESFFEYYRLGSESAHIEADDEGNLYAESAGGDHRVYVSPGHTALEESLRFNDGWSERTPLSGIGVVKGRLIDPYLRSDGETLYFASDSTPGIGGLDIYRTTYNAEEQTYYQPERLGMPFNSPFDDYMMAIDETHQVGWWATERGATADSICLYLFLLNDEPHYLDAPSVSRARIDRIADTWQYPEGYADLVETLMTAPQTPSQTASLHILIAEGREYDAEDEFENPRALEMYRYAETLRQRIHNEEENLQAWRNQYLQASAYQRQQLAPQILQAEDSLSSLYTDLEQSTLTYRRLENLGE